MKRIIKYVFLIFIGVYALQSCMGDGTTREQRKYLDNLKPTKPTSKELIYVQTLENRGFSNITLDIPIIGYVCKGCSSYIIKMDCPFNLTEANQDSVIQANRDIAKELYTSIIEDSIIAEFGDIRVEFTVQKTEIKRWHHILVRNYNKTTLGKWAGFKVVETAPGKFERRKLQ